MELSNPFDGLLTIAEFSAWSGLGKTKIYAEVRAKRLTTVKIGRGTRIERAEARRWLAALPRRGGQPTDGHNA